MRVAWIIGSGGLLGGALCRYMKSVDTQLFNPVFSFSWDKEDKLLLEFEKAVAAFSSAVYTGSTSAGGSFAWEIYWAAGVGTMSSNEDALALETRVLAHLIRCIALDSRLACLPGAFAFASSAGAIYAGALDYVVTERTPSLPTTAYAREKMIQEDLIRAFVSSRGMMSGLLARFSTLYGTGQSQVKRQGLISHFARSLIRGKVIHVFVPLDTIRDYLFVDDAAIVMISVLRHKGLQSSGTCTKIIASEEATTISELIAIFRKIARRMPRVCTSVSEMTQIYNRRVCFKSVVMPKTHARPRTSLVVGISRLLADEVLRFSRPSKEKETT